MKRAVLMCLFVLGASWMVMAQPSPTKAKAKAKAKTPKAAAPATSDPVAASDIYCAIFPLWWDGNDCLFFAEELIRDCWPLDPYYVWGDLDSTECPDDCSDGCTLTTLGETDQPQGTGHQPSLLDLHSPFVNMVPPTYPHPTQPDQVWKPRNGFKEIKSAVFRIDCKGRTRRPFSARLCESMFDGEAADHPKKDRIWRARFGLESPEPDTGAKLLKGVKDPTDPRRCTVKWDGREFVVFTVDPI